MTPSVVIDSCFLFAAILFRYPRRLGNALACAVLTLNLPKSIGQKLFIGKIEGTGPLTCFVWLAYRAKVGGVFVFVRQNLLIGFSEAVRMHPLSAWTLTLEHSEAWAVLV